LKPDWTFRWLLDPSQISPGNRDAEWTVPQRKAIAGWLSGFAAAGCSRATEHDHAQLLVRYMFLMNPDEQRQLLAAGPATTACADSSYDAESRACEESRLNHVRSRSRAALGTYAARVLRVSR
jgi:hypothetical protein